MVAYAPGQALYTQIVAHRVLGDVSHPRRLRLAGVLSARAGRGDPHRARVDGLRTPRGIARRLVGALDVLAVDRYSSSTWRSTATASTEARWKHRVLVRRPGPRRHRARDVRTVRLATAASARPARLGFLLQTVEDTLYLHAVARGHSPTEGWGLVPWLAELRGRLGSGRVRPVARPCRGGLRVDRNSGGAHRVCDRARGRDRRDHGRPTPWAGAVAVDGCALVAVVTRMALTCVATSRFYARPARIRSRTR